MSGSFIPQYAAIKSACWKFTKKYSRGPHLFICISPRIPPVENYTLINR